MSTTSKTTDPPARAEVEESFAIGPDGTRIYLRRRAGPDPLTLVLCDGIACDGFIYKYLWDDLADVATVVHWHYRGHGRSAIPVDANRIAVTDHAADLDCVRSYVLEPDVVLVGHSFGTQVALEAYRLRPAKVRGLIFLCGSFGRITHTFKGTDVLANVLPNLIDFVTRHPKLARAVWSRVPPQLAIQVARLIGDIDTSHVAPADVEPYFQHVTTVDFPMFLRMLRAAGEHSAEDLLGRVEVPVLIVAGDSDSFTPVGLAEAMATAIPRAELLLIPGGTHVAPLEHRALVAGRIQEFLAERVGLSSEVL